MGCAPLGGCDGDRDGWEDLGGRQGWGNAGGNRVEWDGMAEFLEVGTQDAYAGDIPSGPTTTRDDGRVVDEGF
jgi:hypothetical protein